VVRNHRIITEGVVIAAAAAVVAVVAAVAVVAVVVAVAVAAGGEGIGGARAGAGRGVRVGVEAGAGVEVEAIGAADKGRERVKEQAIMDIAGRDQAVETGKDKEIVRVNTESMAIGMVEGNKDTGRVKGKGTVMEEGKLLVKEWAKDKGTG
jgi:hypothetical protein